VGPGRDGNRKSYLGFLGAGEPAGYHQWLLFRVFSFCSSFRALLWGITVHPFLALAWKERDWSGFCFLLLFLFFTLTMDERYILT